MNTAVRRAVPVVSFGLLAAAIVWAWNWAVGGLFWGSVIAAVVVIGAVLSRDRSVGGSRRVEATHPLTRTRGTRINGHFYDNGLGYSAVHSADNASPFDIGGGVRPQHLSPGI